MLCKFLGLLSNLEKILSSFFHTWAVRFQGICRALLESLPGPWKRPWNLSFILFTVNPHPLMSKVAGGEANHTENVDTWGGIWSRNPNVYWVINIDTKTRYDEARAPAFQWVTKLESWVIGQPSFLHYIYLHVSNRILLH